MDNNSQGMIDPTKQILINAQYVKDLSFENPGSPASLLSLKQQPRIDLNVDIQANHLQDGVFEIALNITAAAKVNENALFLTDLTYAGIFTLNDIPEDQKEMVLLVYCPNILFPFARRIIADVTRDGGFPPLMIDPIDFATLYFKRHQQTASESVN